MSRGTHGHGHATAAQAHRGRLLGVLVLTLVVLVVEVVGGVLSGSFALVADAGHMLTDAAGVGLALGATALAARPATATRTFGWQRAEILAALVNGLVVAAVGVAVIVGGVARIASPGEVEAPLMLAVAVVGLVANAVGLALLRPGQQESLTVRGAYLEVLGDLLGSAAVVVAAVVVLATGFVRADGIVSVLIGLLIVPRAVALLREVGAVLLEATPRGVDLDAVRAHICRVPGVLGVHDLHAWTITSGVPVLSAHVEVPDALLSAGEAGRVLDDLRHCLAGHFDVDHCTFQLEPPSSGRERHAHA
ncbi:cation diffusion facilitator family transporter [Cellulomonas fengjieae]|uniref:Cation transporter n=1 Tax=Cellulomonas fengjieae TaxID=2819978 RepID=A0ABS3SCS5_9CELL|nr:cation diffusion facilitator family transporter [Cellulomonas fengjieae]MBO3083309.1 cation transporter [Cellulomonas fengjieae]QVI65342.1 cation transporter [Cellulomonas fengjieae]